jgi:3-dehydro-L-gulonate 2-dehydrogenase
METSAPVDPSHPVHFPGEHMKQVREENMKLGIPVDEGIWQKVCEM